MTSWLALVFAPTLALGVQSVMYALVTPSCAGQHRLALHGAAAAALLLVVVLAALAFRDLTVRHAEPGSLDSDEGGPRTARRFIAMVATAVASLSALVIVAMWFGVWVLSPCDPRP
ncbi:hypothetical protein HK414_21615 [Ramlibacter terrae]|uniref:Uncharacterized protein n=1 Tax=Ramlibacter terrae TaxID=2732511 RepID=A0ABX6P5Y4_9BURK|nr:hypothetical protein HK414_21615 [Ramlibacter terrae]